MKKNILSFAMAFCLLLSIPMLAQAGSNVFYYGFLPGTDYKYFNPLQKIDLKGKEFNIEIIDARGKIKKVECFKDDEIDRDTELEGDLGLNYFRNYLITMIENNNGKINAKSENKIVVKLEGLSYLMYGFVFIRAHGLVQFEVSAPGLEKKYCSDMTDADDDSPLSQFSAVTRKTASRIMVSGSTRRALEFFLVDLQK